MISNSGFWDRKDSDEIVGRLSENKKIIKDLETIKDEIYGLIEIKNTVDEEMLELIENDIVKLDKSLGKLEINLLLNAEFDKNNCFLEIHAGAGGTESCDWSMMLLRMYKRWCENKKYNIEIIDYQEGDEAGIKSVTLHIKGKYAYGYLKCEKGVHRLVRLSPFNANNKRQTSFASVLVVPEIKDVEDIIIEDKDLRIDVFRSSGSGGQSVNTTDSAVRITHLPTKIVVTCQNERSQIQNKEEALNILKSKLKLIKIEEQNKKLDRLTGEKSNIEFGQQIRSYVMHPYSMVKDHRTNLENTNVNQILDGEIDIFIEAKLREDKNEKV